MMIPIIPLGFPWIFEIPGFRPCSHVAKMVYIQGKMEELVLSIRKRKNLKLQMPLLADYLDKL